MTIIVIMQILKCTPHPHPHTHKQTQKNPSKSVPMAIHSCPSHLPNLSTITHLKSDLTCNPIDLIQCQHIRDLLLTDIMVGMSPFPWGMYFNGGLVDIRAWMSNYSLQFYMDGTNFPRFNLSAISIAPGIGKPAHCEPTLLTHWG